jgi:hypothetical protein
VAGKLSKHRRAIFTISLPYREARARDLRRPAADPDEMTDR